MGGEVAPARAAARHSISRAGSGAIVVTVLFCLVASAVGIVFSLQAEHASDRAINTWLPAGRVVNRLLADMVDQETGERGYVITAQPQFLQPYEAGRVATAASAGSLRHELVGDTRDETLLGEALVRYRRWLVGFAQPQIRDVQRGDDAAAVAEEETGRGKTLFDALRRAFTALDDSIASNVSSATARVRSLQADVVWLIVAVLVCALVGAVAGLASLRRWVIRPIQGLERVVSRVSTERSDRPVETLGPKEIASLGDSVEAMRQRLLQQAAQLREERHMVRALQEALLPRQLPRFANFEFAARYVPAASDLGVGGDWYNVRQVGPTRLFVAVGDVAGRGLDAAALMASLRYAINAYAAEDADPGNVLTRLSRLFDLASEGRFATVVACLFDAERNEMRIASAGHPSPVVVAPDGSRPVAVTPNVPIGLGPATYTDDAVLLPPRGTVLLFSDGLVERRGESIDTSIERLASRARPELPIPAMLQELLELRATGESDDTVACGVRLQPVGPAAVTVPDAEGSELAGRLTRPG